MKKLKLNHTVANLVRSGKKSSTWRLFDDKDLTVNDTIELIDKLKPDQPQTWQVMGTARITRVIEKRLGNIEASDYDGRNRYESPGAMLEELKGYYGSNITWDTPVKIIDFDFAPKITPNTGSSSDAEVRAIGSPISLHSNHLATAPATRKVIVYADGGSRGNPGPSACGYIVMNEDEAVLVDKGVYLGITTNNQAEYLGLKFALEEAHKMGAREVAVRLDSLLVINQMKGIFKVKNRDLWPIHDALKELVKSFDSVTFTHVPRALNQKADAAVNRVLDEAKNTSKV